MVELPRPRNRHGFEIALVCALGLEGHAVEAFLDEKYETDEFSYRKAPGDCNAYTTGRIGRHSVVLVYMPGMGKVNAAATAAGLRSSFQNIKLALLVGICGGVPVTADKTEVLLGDVIFTTNIIQIDFGRQYPDRFIRRDSTEASSSRLGPEIRAFLQKISGSHVQVLQDRTSSYLVEKQRHTSSFLDYPGLEKDVLFPAHYQHKHQIANSTIACDVCAESDDQICHSALSASCKDLGCDESLLLTRGRVSDPWRPFIHFGGIASADVVMKSGMHRDEIARRENITAFEMEGAGMWDYLPTIVIKSVCDYADSHKNKVWQNYSAYVAAACAKAVLADWRIENMAFESLESCETQVKFPMDYGVASVYSLNEDTQTKKLEKEAMRSLTYPNMDTRRYDINTAHEGTCDWFFRHHQFKKWISRQDLQEYNAVLWIKGKPGAGKSTLMKHLVLHCQETLPKNHIVAAYFFNARGGHLENSTIGMFRSLLYQILDIYPRFQKSLGKLYSINERKSREGWTWRANELKELLETLCKQLKTQPISLFIDALDECDDSEVRNVVSMLEALSITNLRQGDSLNICLSSRHYPSISMRKMLQVVVEEEGPHDDDIALYVQDKLLIPNEEVKAELLHKSQGVFMWVILVIQLLNREYDEGSSEITLWRTLAEIPGDLDDVFRILLEKDNPHKSQTVLTLLWVLFGARLLTLKQLHYAVSSWTEDWDAYPPPPDEDADRTSSEAMKRFIITRSRGLVEIRSTPDMEVQFIHETVRDFLLRRKRIQSLDPTLGPNILSASHDRLVQSSLYWIRRAQCRFSETTYRDNPFLHDLCDTLFYHIYKAHVEGMAQHKRLRDMQQDLATLNALMAWDFKSNNKNSVWTKQMPLYYAACMRHEKLVQAILADPTVEVNTRGGYHGNALLAACRKPAHPGIIRLLLDAGADVNAPAGPYGHALQTVCGHKYDPRPISMLLDAGADVNAQGGGYGSALHAACARSHARIDIVELLLGAGADANAQNDRDGTALHIICAGTSQYQLHIIRALLKAGTDVNAPGKRYGTALQAACVNYNSRVPLSVVKMLLKAGADPNIKGGTFGTALNAVRERLFSETDKTALIQALRDAGAVDSDGIPESTG